MGNEKIGVDRAEMTVLLELCINHAMCIYNGQVGSHMRIWKETNTDGSEIDYDIGLLILFK